MSKAVPVFIACLSVGLLGACAAPGPEKQQTAAPQAATSQNAKDDLCEETTGSRFKRCPGSSGTGMVSGGAVPPGTSITGPNSKSN